MSISTYAKDNCDYIRVIKTRCRRLIKKRTKASDWNSVRLWVGILEETEKAEALYLNMC